MRSLCRSGNPPRELLRPQFEELLTGPLPGAIVASGSWRGRGAGGNDSPRPPALRMWIAIDRHLAEVGEEFGGAVTSRLEGEEMGICIDQLGVHLSGLQCLVENNVLQEGTGCSFSPRGSGTRGVARCIRWIELREGWSTGGHFDQERIIIRRDHTPASPVPASRRIPNPAAER